MIFGNPRGSTGYGEEFVAATRHDWEAPIQDVMAIADLQPSSLGRQPGWVLPGKLRRLHDQLDNRAYQPVQGCGFCRSTCNRFSQFGTSDAAYMNGQFEFDGDPWDNPEAYLSRSPIMYVRNVETPLLLIHSEGDLRCPISQADEMFVALKKLRKPVVMVRFPGESHNLSRTGKPLHRVERLEYMVAWFDRYMGPEEKDYSVPLKPANVVLNCLNSRRWKKVNPAVKQRSGRRHIQGNMGLSKTQPANKAAGRLEGRVCFEREVPINRFIVDFLVDGWLVVEVDGWSHLTASRQLEDTKRQSGSDRGGFR